FFFFSSRRRHTRSKRDWSSDVCSSDLGATIGSDVPFCVHGETAIASGRGEIVEKLPSAPSCWIVLAKPDIGVSTKNIFKRYIHRSEERRVGKECRYPR